MPASLGLGGVLTRLELGGYVVEHDASATAAAYSRIDVPGPEACGCSECRAWAAARASLVPGDVRQLLAQLGVPLDGELEVSGIDLESGACLYSGWYLSVGRVLTKPAWPSPGSPPTFDVGGWAMWFGDSATVWQPEAFKAGEFCALHFWAEINSMPSASPRTS